MAYNGIRDWSNLQYFLAVADLGSFQAAARHLGTNQSTVARRMHRFEEELKTKLFDRHAHGMTLTVSGRAIMGQVAGINQSITEVEKSLVGLDVSESGLVTLAVTEGIGSYWLLPALPAFHLEFPGIDLRVKTNQANLNLLGHDADIALQLERPSEPRVVAWKATSVQHRLFASQTYVARKGLPASLKELRAHDILDYEPYHSQSYTNWWVKEVLSAARVRFSCNSASIYLAATRQGIGIGLFPAFYARAASDLLALPVEVPSESQVWLVTHEETNKARRVRVVLNFLKSQFDKDRRAWFSPSDY